MDPLTALRLKIQARAEPGRAVHFLDRLSTTQVGDVVHLDYYGDWGGESYCDLLEALGDNQIASSVASLILRGPDEGANGTRNWDLTSLAESAASFPNLRSLCIEQTQPSDHNKTIIARIYDEDGVLARILAKAPRLEVLISPSAPNEDFFKVGKHSLQVLDVDAGYNHQNFIANLARSSCFSELRHLGFGEYNETYMDDYAEQVTPFAAYRELFASPAFATVRGFHWRNPRCSKEQLAELKELKKDCQVLIVSTSAEYM